MGDTSSTLSGRWDAQEAGSPVLLHVYDCGPVVRVCNEATRPLGTGAFHCGVEVLQSPVAVASVPDPRPPATVFAAPPAAGVRSDVGVVGFFFPNADEPCDRLCKASFCATWWDVSPDRIEIELPRHSGITRRFRNAAAALEACRFSGQAREFEGLSGTEALKLKMELHGEEDPTYGGYQSPWACMLNILRAKFKTGSRCALQLLRTEDHFLLQHRSEHKGGDLIWSDGFDGSGKNWMGLQLMLVRDELVSRFQGRWTAWVHKFLDVSTGEARNQSAWSEWQRMVVSAAFALNQAEKQCADTFGQELRVDINTGATCTLEQLNSQWPHSHKKRPKYIQAYWESMCVPFHGLRWEWSFCAGEAGDGVFRCPPRRCDSCGPYRESVIIGHTKMTGEEFSLLLHELATQYPSNRYDVLRCNCTHFSDKLCRSLGVGGIPDWVQRLASELLGCSTAVCKGPGALGEGCLAAGHGLSKSFWVPPPEVLTSELLFSEKDPWFADPRSAA